jgi:DNA-binding NarL/FixJ family response regulator
MISLIIADERPLVREGLRRILADYGDVQVIAETPDPAALLAALRRSRADVILLDVSLSGTALCTLIERIRRRRRAPRVLLLGVRPGDATVHRALRAGACGVLTREETPAELIAAVRRVAAGAHAVSAAVGAEAAPAMPGLSERELEVLRLFGSGRNGREVAEALGLSPKTVSTYRTRILKKLGLRNVGELVRYVFEHGLTD